MQCDCMYCRYRQRRIRQAEKRTVIQAFIAAFIQTWRKLNNAN